MLTDSLDCLCAGIIVADIVCQPIEKSPPAGALIKTAGIEFSIGGCSSNMAVDMVRLGMKVGLSGRVGHDVFGREVRDRLDSAGVDTTRLETSDATPTSSTFVLNVKNEDRRFIHCVGANAEYDGSGLTESIIRGTKSLFIGGFGLMESLTAEKAIRLFRIAREAGVTTAFNVVVPESTAINAWINPVLPWTDYFFCNDDEGRRITGQTDPVRQAESLREIGAKTAIVTCGERGSILIGPKDRLKAGIHQVKPLDPTGTGDAFASGFLYGLLRGESIERSLKLGTALGASCVRSMGATTGVFNESELLDFVQANELKVESIPS